MDAVAQDQDGWQQAAKNIQLLISPGSGVGGISAGIPTSTGSVVI